ncbi:dolichyl-phosphate-mannose-protein mannosyltransferase [Nematocida minor]|uniref:dolichyl-phosphate-mannose-protein mannosyltransferase n=1 Tax=Nematocida minor TaxID=1912983 RepID=UPI00221E8DA8|nr:dolichyl-phosphate-mannose-protein mannosyltransferase [Nematocida minor]KAI5190679.1 dolichyl-phosphate-mannose-protein mannosyltransferase [Nematocida minor]
MELERVKQEIVQTTKIAKDHRIHKSTAKKSSYSYNCKDVLIIWLLSFLIRLYRIEKGNFVMWDEAHFGKFASHYINREFFFDVHPPLGKLLTALGGWLVDMSNDFVFSSEDVYPSSVDFVGMRIFHALFGSFIPVCGYMIVRTIRMSRFTAVAIGLSLVFDNALVGISRLILLDPFLLLFICLSEVFLARIVMDSRRVDRIGCDLVCLGICIGAAMSIKWVGLLTVSHVGVFCIYVLLQEIRNRRVEFFKIFLRLAATLIILPVTIYLSTFYVHFLVLNKSGPGDGEMSSRFQSFLRNNEVLRNEERMEYGNRVTIRNNTVGTGLLHSHIDRYPSGGQQVTAYPHKDMNNHWRVLKVGADPEGVKGKEDLVLFHIETNSYLAIDESADRINGSTSYTLPEEGKKAVCMTQEEMNNSILSNTVFHLEPVKERESGISPLTTLFYIRNIQHNCYLSYSGNKLPKWGHQQGEIYCSNKKIEGSVWNVEMNRSEETEGADKEPKQPTFKDFLMNTLELNKAMNVVNNGLVDDGNDVIGSLPIQWIFPKKWLKFNRWDGSVPRFALIGNIITWYLGSANIPVLMASVLLGLAKKRARGSNRYISKEMGRLYIVLGGWLFHLVPFLLVKRILYLHHYLPCLFFSVLGLSMVLEKRRALSYVFILSAVLFFISFSSVTYGYLGEIENLRGFSFLNWNIYKE